MNPVTVAHTLGSYPVYVEAGGLRRLASLVERHLAGRRVAMVADEQVYRLHRDDALGTGGWVGDVLTFPAGERSKTRETWAALTDGLLERGYGRDSGIVALGGGVAGDLAGFVAATYLRGLPYIQAPTTLLAMVDASVGGKTAVDTPRGKNLVGAFHPPAAVVADPLVLKTLPDREYRAGLAEAVKHGLIADREYFEWMEREVEALLRRDDGVVARLVKRSIEIKADVVGADERETGRRAILNAGHTVAHALEHASDYTLPHGEAVALGLIAECALAIRVAGADPTVQQRVKALLQRFGLPVRQVQPLASDRLIGAMTHDKKNRSARIRFALPDSLGQIGSTGSWTTEAPEEAIRAALGAIS